MTFNPAPYLPYIIVHVFLPPKLPQKYDGGTAQDLELTTLFKDALQSFCDLQPVEAQLHWQRMISGINYLTTGENASSSSIKEVIEALPKLKPGDASVLHITSQNAGLIIRSKLASYQFEVFELAPKNIAVTSTKGRLIRCFPGPTISLDKGRVTDLAFRKMCIQFLEELEQETPAEAIAKTVKAGTTNFESRETVHPRLMPELFSGILRAIGEVPSDDFRIYKHTREEVLWRDTELPWRRSSRWLLLRVFVQTSCVNSEVVCPADFKAYMVYFMARILNHAIEADYSSDLLFIMISKIERRLRKLEQAIQNQPWLDSVHSTLSTAHSKLEEQRARSAPETGAEYVELPGFDQTSDTTFILQGLKAHISQMHSQKFRESDNKKTDLECSIRIKQCSSVLPLSGYSYPYTMRAEYHIVRADIEAWVAEHLAAWLRANQDTEEAREYLGKLFNSCVGIALQDCGAEDPENQSLLYLTLVEIWIALDKCATAREPLLKDYRTGLPTDLFDLLLLPRLGQMERLATAQSYILNRNNTAEHDFHDVFQNFDADTSFLFRYHETSKEQQNYIKNTEKIAIKDAERKIQELKLKQQKYEQLISTFRSEAHRELHPCSYITKPDLKKKAENALITLHDRDCARCAPLEEARKLVIGVHEWPVPEDEGQARAVAFEKAIPSFFLAWRECTYKLLVDILSPKREESRDTMDTPLYRVGDNRAGTSDASQRFELKSYKKPFEISHYKQLEGDRLYAATEEIVCVNHGKSYAFFDSRLKKWTHELLDCCSIEESCTFSLTAPDFESIQYAIERTTHWTNKTIANQAQCPESLTEYHTFTNLRVGNRLQWINILNVLTCRSFDFTRDEVFFLIAQASWQAGPSLHFSARRDSHTRLEDTSFARLLLSSLEIELSNVESNWQGAGSVRICALVACRLLELSSHEEIQQGCFECLGRARKISLTWTRSVCQLLRSDAAVESEVLNNQAIELALTFQMTFDVENHHLSSIFGSAQNVAAFIEIASIIHDRRNVSKEPLSPVMTFLYGRSTRLYHHAELPLRDSIVADSSGINEAIRQLWHGYSSKCSWSTLPAPNHRWVATQTCEAESASSLNVHFNLLNGLLLVNGSLLSRLPESFQKDILYRKLFGKRILDVVPSTRPCLMFETRFDIHGHRVYFGKRGENLVIQIRKANCILEMLPVAPMIEDLPLAFLNDYIHWRDLKTGSIELRPLDDAWSSRAGGWRVESIVNGFRLSSGTSRLICNRSRISQSIYKCLEPIETPHYIHISINSGRLAVHLPRLKLDFHCVNNKVGGRMESKQFRGMFVDACQDFGTFAGLKTKLVLRGANNSNRIVIVPHGSIERSSSDITVKTNYPSRPAYHSFGVDTRLGRLTDDNSLLSRLYKIYIHALTSYCLPDPLTGRTGTEEALAGLSSASTLSITKASDAELLLLDRLKVLTPKRKYYPKDSKLMQTVKWSPLPWLSQHEAFHDRVSLIIEHIRSQELFQGGLSNLGKQTRRGDINLSHRAALRNSSFRADGYGAETFTTSHDVFYDSRDADVADSRENLAYTTALLVDSWSGRLKVSTNLLQEVEQWKTDIPGLLSIAKDCETVLRYHSKWLWPPRSELPKVWCQLYQELRSSTRTGSRYKIMAFLSTLAYSNHARQDLIHTLLAFATQPKFRHLSVPAFQCFDFSKGHFYNGSTIKTVVRNAMVHAKSEASCTSSSSGESQAAAQSRQQESRTEAEKLAEVITSHLRAQWPAYTPSLPEGDAYIKCFDLARLSQSVQSCFRIWPANVACKKWLEDVQLILNSVPISETVVQHTYSFNMPKHVYTEQSSYTAFVDLLRNEAPSKVFCPDSRVLLLPGHETISELMARPLVSFLQNFSVDGLPKFDYQYLSDLRRSADALMETSDRTELHPSAFNNDVHEAYLSLCQERVTFMYEDICRQLFHSIRSHQAHCDVNLPRISPAIILSSIATNSPLKGLSHSWKYAIVQYGLALTALQRAERLLACSRSSDTLAELTNLGHQGWDPMANPDWLLFELENELLIRKEQADIAHAMISPPSASSSLMQLNMGLGKSSVIIPIVASTLADKSQLCRVIVLRALSDEMIQMLVARLGGLVNRRIYFLPFSRSVTPNVLQAQSIMEKYKECLELARASAFIRADGIDLSLSGDKELGDVMIQTQKWLSETARDVLDESDEILDIRSELVYTIGLPREIEFGPDRWLIIQRVLDTMKDHLRNLETSHDRGIELGPWSDGDGIFPRFRILDPNIGRDLLLRVARRICDHGLPGLPLFQFENNIRNLLFNYLVEPDLVETHTDLQSIIRESSYFSSALLLLRGLFAGGVINFAFSAKRWRVNYGLDLARTRLAVPYRGKDVPAARSEFSHPDTSIILTCVSYYYAGLTEKQAVACFQHLLKSDDCQEEYKTWISGNNEIAPTFKKISGVNMKDLTQWSANVFPFIHRSKAMIDFYLTNLYPHKLSSSGWDIAGLTSRPLTGFSGTNDSRYILPGSVQQHDLQPQLPTNARVLLHILQAENKVEAKLTGNCQLFDVDMILNIATTSIREVRVILDVGAQIVELSNEEVARRWLSIAPLRVKAAIFFDSSHVLCVLDREEIKEPLHKSPYEKQLDACVVYLDDAHTRGTDLKMPSNFRAIVTLGPDLTKDRLTQACMRMRQLGDGNSLLFCCGAEVRRKILKTVQKSAESLIEVKDILRWCIYNTQASIKIAVVPWALQGNRFYDRQAILEANPHHIPDAILEKQAQPLKELYGIREQPTFDIQPGPMDDLSYMQEREAICQKCHEFDLTSMEQADFYAEQERELQPETEREYQVERTHIVPACSHEIHPAVQRLVKEGILDIQSDAFIPAFATLANTSAGKLYGGSVCSENLLVTKDFAQTVWVSQDQPLDLYLKPVEWVITVDFWSTIYCVIISAFEAQEFLPDIGKQEYVVLHAYRPRMSPSMPKTNGIASFSIPELPPSWTRPEITLQLNLFAGQTYLSTYEEYVEVCQFLGLCYQVTPTGVQVERDNFVLPSSREAFDPRMQEVCPFDESPVEYMKMIITIRRKGMNFESSHMGKILNGDLLTRKDFEDL
ncbi:p-loop containing nucleoside triphosphate hydrolase protein [Rutstroemia sp. NJR-2017a WRK4]|nr:p-loop containing nucleoside triphosphate hydrolase protein [Rutstroemia sp. NJR-2017a WRK4]